MSEATPLVVHVVYALRMGGLENGLVNLLNRMPPERYRHAIICLRDATDFAARLHRPDVQVYTLGKRDGHDNGLYLRMWRLLRRLRDWHNPGILDTA